MRSSLNIALLGRDFLWGGGTELLRSIANALLSVGAEQEIRLSLLVPVRNKIDSFVDVRRVILKSVAIVIKEKKLTIPRPEPVADHSFFDFFSNVDGKLEIVEYNEETGLIPALQRSEADVVMPALLSLGESFPFPWVGYVYDFQHKYYPGYFTARECFDRDIHFATMLRDAKAVIVNARSVKDDIVKFFPYRRCEVFNLPFSASPVSSWLEDCDPGLLVRYKLPPRYFLISDQFWIHKAHSTAFRALAMLANDRGCADLHLVCTGKMEDYRFPDHIRDLQNEIRNLGIEDRVHFLGHIPKIDQIAIMKKSLAVLQPTLFEGGPGGGAVYDAVSLGVPAVLSDIPVNREIEGQENLFYFEVGSPPALAETLKAFLKKEIRSPSMEALVSRGGHRKKLMGERLLEVINFVIENNNLK
jgi:glycosyltransferase involved in cell wall biosynthesis